MATRLAPTVSPDTEFFWNGCRENKLLIQRCTGCQALRQPARPMCPTCNSLDWDTVESIRPRHRVQLRDAAAPADAADGVPVHRRAGRTRRRRAVGVQPVRNRARPTSKSACPSRSSTRRSTPSTAKTSCCTSSARPDRRARHGLHVHRRTRDDRQGRASALRTPRHPGTPHRTRSAATCATTPRCGANWRPPTCWESRCPRTSAAAATASSSWRCFSPRWVGASRRCRSTPPCFSAPTPSPATATTHSGSGTFPPSSTAHRLLTAGLAEPGRSDPTASGDHGATRRRRLAPRRHQGAGTSGAARPHHHHPGLARRRRRRRLPGRRGLRRCRDSAGCDDQRRTARRRHPRRCSVSGNRSARRRRPRDDSNRSMPVRLSGCARSNSG